jgi:hypothetical protein
MKIVVILLLMIVTMHADQYMDQFNDKNESLSGHIRLIHVLYGKENGYDPQTGSTVGFNLKYRTKSFYGLQANVGIHYVGDTSLTDFSKDSNGKYIKKIASGLFLTPDFSSKTVLDEANIVYRYNDSIVFKIGRRHPPETLPSYISSPIALFKVSQVENAYEAVSIHVKPLDDTVVSIAQITRMMLGSRATTDYALIGEYTNTAGVAVNPSELKGKFTDIEKLAFANGLDSDGNSVDTSGITMFSFINRLFPQTTIQLWNYYAYDIVNFLNFQVDKKFSLNNMDTTLKFQYLKEDDIGDSLAGDIGASMFGVAIDLKMNAFAFSAAYNNSNGEFFNPWGFDSGFTSSLFSRNEYRDDVSAYKVGALYKVNPQLKVSMSYANYGQSNSYGGNVDRTLYPSRDATEIDTVVSYKPTEKLTVKLLNVLRTSEYESSTSDRKQNQWRIIAEYKL